MKRIRIGIVGMGNVAEKLHIPGIRRCAGAELSAICDPDPARLAFMAKFLDLDPDRVFGDHGALMASDFVDAVIICTPNHSHCAIAMDAIRAGKPFAVEKPVGINPDEVGALLAARDSGAPAMVCFTYRYLKAVRKARKLISEGLLGDIRHVYAQYLQDWGNNDAVPLTWRYRRQVAGSGVSGDLGVHQIDLVRFLTSREFERVVADAPTIKSTRSGSSSQLTGTVDVDDCCHVLGRLEGAATVNLVSTRFAFGCGNEQRIEVYGSKGSLRIKLRGGMDLLETCFKDSRSEGAGMESVPLDGEAQPDQTQALCDMVNDRGDGLSATLEDGYRAQLVLDGILNSADTGNWFEF